MGISCLKSSNHHLKKEIFLPSTVKSTGTDYNILNLHCRAICLEKHAAYYLPNSTLCPLKKNLLGSLGKT